MSPDRWSGVADEDERGLLLTGEADYVAKVFATGFAVDGEQRVGGDAKRVGDGDADANLADVEGHDAAGWEGHGRSSASWFRSPARMGSLRRRTPEAWEDGVGDGGVDARDAEFADALDAEWIDESVDFVEHDGLDVDDVGVDGDVVFGEVLVDEAGGFPVEFGGLVQGGRKAPDLAAVELRPGCSAIHDASAGEDADHARDADFAGVAADADLDEVGAVGRTASDLSGSRRREG